MVIKGELERAIACHLEWKKKLQTAIDTGTSTIVPESLWLDTNCQFGRWLHYEISASDKTSFHYYNVRHLHSLFHQEASKALAFATNGQPEEALAMLGDDGDYAKASEVLIEAVNEWITSLDSGS